MIKRKEKLPPHSDQLSAKRRQGLLIADQLDTDDLIDVVKYASRIREQKLRKLASSH